MTHPRRIMLEELQRRHYSQATTQRYIRFVERFAQRKSLEKTKFSADT